MSQFQASGSSGGEVYSTPVVEIKEEEKVEQPPRERSNTLPSAEPAPLEEVATGDVILRVPTGPKQSPEKRKSGEFYGKKKKRPKSAFLCRLYYHIQHLLKSLRSQVHLLVLKS